MIKILFAALLTVMAINTIQARAEIPSNNHSGTDRAFSEFIYSRSE